MILFEDKSQTYQLTSLTSRLEDDVGNKHNKTRCSCIFKVIESVIEMSEGDVFELETVFNMQL